MASLPRSPTDLAKAEIFIEFKWSFHDNPFTFELDTVTGSPFVQTSKRSIDMLGQIMAYAAAQLGSQF